MVRYIVIEMPYKDPDRQREYQREWVKRRRDRRKAYRDKLRKEVLEFFGGKCVYCDCDETKALEINHVNGGGRKAATNRVGTAQYYLNILKGRVEEELELTCRVCNSVHYLKLLGIEGFRVTWNK